jgi:hypothetical protein
MTAVLYCCARIDRRTIRRHDADNVDNPIDPTSLAYAVFAALAADVAVFKGDALELWRPRS